MSNTKKAVIRLLLSPLLKSILKRELILALARKEICATEILSDFPAVLANQQGQNAQRTSGNTAHWHPATTLLPVAECSAPFPPDETGWHRCRVLPAASAAACR